jgi:16S rRNA (guanine966-N2)-methyltransferase
MRITGGQVKGRPVASPKRLTIRPSSDLIREAVFNIIGQDLSDQKVLDLFAGTGSLGLEALSRGALWAFFVDNSQQSINLIKKNLALLGYQRHGVVIRKDLRKGFPQGHSILKERFDLVFLDPPYRKGLASFWLEQLSTRSLLSSGALIIAESAKNEEFPVSLGDLEMVDTRYYGDTRITIYGYEVR